MAVKPSQAKKVITEGGAVILGSPDPVERPPVDLEGEIDPAARARRIARTPLTVNDATEAFSLTQQSVRDAMAGIVDLMEIQKDAMQRVCDATIHKMLEWSPKVTEAKHQPTVVAGPHGPVQMIRAKRWAVTTNLHDLALAQPVAPQQYGGDNMATLLLPASRIVSIHRYPMGGYQVPGKPQGYTESRDERIAVMMEGGLCYIMLWSEVRADFQAYAGTKNQHDDYNAL